MEVNSLILHLEADLLRSVEWAENHGNRWAFTLSNAGAYYFESRCELGQLNEVNWDAVSARQWSGRGVPATVQEGKQAEFLIEDRFPWELVERIGIRSDSIANRVDQGMTSIAHRPAIEVRSDWYCLD
jgi:hypothetical protein